MDEDKASRFISSLVKSIQALCNGFVDFSTSIEVIGHIHLNIDRNVKLDYVLTEEVSKSASEGSTVFASHSYHSQSPSSVASKNTNDTSNHGQKSRKDNETDPLGLSALPREVPNTSKSDSQSSNRIGDNRNSSHTSSGSVGFSRNSDSETLRHERSSFQVEDSTNKRRKIGPFSQSNPHPAAKRNRPNDFGSDSRTVVKESGFEVIEIKEEPDEDVPAVFFGGSSSGQDIQTPDFSNVVMESLDRVSQLEQNTDLAGEGGDGMGEYKQPVFPVMFHQGDGMSSSAGGRLPGPSSDPQAIASTSGVVYGAWEISEATRTDRRHGRVMPASHSGFKDPGNFKREIDFEAVEYYDNEDYQSADNQHTPWANEPFDPQHIGMRGVGDAEHLERIRIRRERVKLRVRAHRARKRAALLEAQRAAEAVMGFGRSLGREDNAPTPR